MKPRTAASLFAILAATLPGALAAHGGGQLDVLTPAEAWGRWNLAPEALLPIALGAWLYAQGVFRLWSRSGYGRGISYGHVGAFTAGMLVIAIALVSPLDTAAEELFSLHMVQHLLLILVAPPLLVLGAPDLALLWALPARWRPATARLENRVGSNLTGHGQLTRGPLIVVLLATGVLWAWHVPALYDLAVRNQAVHWAEHSGFLLSALLFWTTVLRLRPRDHADNGLRILYVFGMAAQGSILGALITFTRRPLYASHMEIAPEWDIAPLVDQQIAGLLMWVPPAVLYVGVTAYLFSAWLSAVAARSRAYERRSVSAVVAYGHIPVRNESDGQTERDLR